MASSQVDYLVERLTQVYTEDMTDEEMRSYLQSLTNNSSDIDQAISAWHGAQWEVERYGKHGRRRR